MKLFLTSLVFCYSLFETGIAIHDTATLVGEKLKAAPSQVFVRSQKVEESWMKKEKHEEKLARRKERKLAKKSFIGFTEDVSSNTLGTGTSQIRKPPKVA